MKDGNDVTLNDVQKRVEQMQDALIVKDTLNNLANDGQNADVASILSDSQIRRLQSSQSLKDAKVTETQKNQLIKSIVSRYEDQREDESRENVAYRKDAPQSVEKNPFLGKFNDHVKN